MWMSDRPVKLVVLLAVLATAFAAAGLGTGRWGLAVPVVLVLLVAAMSWWLSATR